MSFENWENFCIDVLGDKYKKSPMEKDGDKSVSSSKKGAKKSAKPTKNKHK